MSYFPSASSSSLPLNRRSTENTLCYLTPHHFYVTRCLKITEKVSFNNASEASYVCILSGQKFIKFKYDILSDFQTMSDVQCVPKCFFDSKACWNTLYVYDNLLIAISCSKVHMQEKIRWHTFALINWSFSMMQEA